MCRRPLRPSLPALKHDLRVRLVDLSLPSLWQPLPNRNRRKLSICLFRFRPLFRCLLLRHFPILYFLLLLLLPLLLRRRRRDPTAAETALPSSSEYIFFKCCVCTGQFTGQVTHHIVSAPITIIRWKYMTLYYLPTYLLPPG